MIAVDTNVLIHVCDQAVPKCRKVAPDLITNAQEGVLLWRVACEFISAFYSEDCRAWTISRACASSIPSSSRSQKGPRRGNMSRGAVGPPRASAPQRRSHRRAHEPRPARAWQPLGHHDLGATAMVAVERRSVPPAERPTAGVAAEKRRERPRLRRADPARRPSAGSRTPLAVSVVVDDGRWHRPAEDRVCDRPRKWRSFPDPFTTRSLLEPSAGSGTHRSPRGLQSGVAPDPILREHAARVKASLAPLAACAALTRPACSRELAITGATEGFATHTCLPSARTSASNLSGNCSRELQGVHRRRARSFSRALHCPPRTAASRVARPPRGRIGAHPQGSLFGVRSVRDTTSRMPLDCQCPRAHLPGTTAPNPDASARPSMPLRPPSDRFRRIELVGRRREAH